MDDFLSNLSTLNPDVWAANEQVYIQQLLNMPNWSQISLLNCTPSHNLPDGALVRFKGMIQDMHSPEMYFNKFQVTNRLTNEVGMKTGKYRDACNLLPHEEITKTDMRHADQRYPFVVVSVPGFSDWALKEEERQNKPQCLDQPNTTKRLNASLKRSHEECADDDKMDVAEEEHKRDIKVDEDVEEKPLAVSREHLLNFPIPDVPGQTCHIKVYTENQLKLNDLVEVVGFLSVNPSLSGEFHDRKCNFFADLETEEEFITHNPPPSLIPRIHVIHYKKLRHCNPLIIDPVEEVAKQALRKASATREHLFKVLTELMLGDKLAAEYLLCYLISHVYMREEALTVGQICLNIGNIPVDKCPNYIKQFHEIIKLISTHNYYHPFTVENLNTLTYVPHKDVQCNRLTSGILQLSRSTHFILDETKMEPGTLNSTGLKNMNAIANMIKMQKIDYDYGYYVMNIDSDIQVLVLSEGKSLLPSNVYIPLKPDETKLEIFNATVEAMRHYLKEDILNDIRVYLTSLKYNKYTINNDIEYVAKDFAEIRLHCTDLAEEALHRLFVLSRLLGLSRGMNTLTHDCWNVAKDLEQQRAQRVQERMASVNEI